MSEADLGDRLASALREATVEVTLEFRRAEDGTKTGRIAVRDREGQAVADLALDSPEAMKVALAGLVELGFRSGAAPAAPGVTPRRAPTSVLVAGVDGYRKGWVAVSLDPSGDVQVTTHPTFAELLSLRAQVIAVDIPIDPAGLGARPTDAAARAFVRGRASSVFSTPPRRALEAATFAEACELARTITGKGISQQAFALRRKILEVQALAEVDERIVEMHPEASFCRLAGDALAESKHTPEGLERRRALLAAAGIVLPRAVAGVPEADLLDAAAGAWTAARYARGEAEALPPEHRDRLGAIWA